MSVDVTRMRLFALLRARGLAPALTEKVCHIARAIKTVAPAAWAVMHRSYLIQVGLTASEAATVYAAFRDADVSEPRNVVQYEADAFYRRASADGYM